MLIKRADLDGIVEGRISLAFRRWKRPTVRAGGTLRTRVGVLAIDDVAKLSESSVNARDAKRAGFESRKALLDACAGREGDLYRIRLRYQGEDPRKALRENARLSKADVDELRDRLARFDRASRRGPWTEQVLRLIADQPEVLAEDLATQAGWDKPWFKAQVRKLKELGLTVSYSPGYRLSPRGAALLRKL